MEQKTKSEVTLFHFRTTTDFLDMVRRAAYLVQGTTNVSKFIRDAVQEKINKLNLKGTK